MSKDINSYVDEFGLISHKIQFSNKWDSGDSMQRGGMCAIAVCLHRPKGFDVPPITKHEISPGIYVRHPRPGDWPSNPKNCSRDQTKPAIVAFGILNLRASVTRMLIQFLKRFMFCQNTENNFGDPGTKIPDPAGPDVWSNFIRALNAWPLWPVLLLGDLVLLINVIVRIYYGRKDFDNVGDDLNVLVDLVQSYRTLPTPLSWLSRKLYFKYRPAWKRMVMTSGREIDPDGCGGQYALDWYFRSDLAPPINDLWRPLIEDIK